MSFVTGLKCIDCGKEFAAKDGPTVCDECAQKGLFHGILDPVYDYAGIKKVVTREVLENRVPGFWKYFEFLPLDDRKHIVTNGRGRDVARQGVESLKGAGRQESLFQKRDGKSFVQLQGPAMFPDSLEGR